MFDFHEKRKLKSYLYFKPTIVALFLLAGLLSTSVYARLTVERDMAKKQASVALELETLNAQASALESQVGYLKSDRGVEEEIRTRYQVAKRGEQVVVILGDPQKPTTTLEVGTSTPKKSWFHFW